MVKRKKKAAERVDWNAEAQRIAATFGKGSKRKKGLFVIPWSTFHLISILGPEAAEDELGVSKTQFYRARRVGGISKVTEHAAEAALARLEASAGKNLVRGATFTDSAPARAEPPTHAPAASPAPAKVVLEGVEGAKTTLFLFEVPKEKAPMVEKFAQHIGATLTMT